MKDHRKWRSELCWPGRRVPVHGAIDFDNAILTGIGAAESIAISHQRDGGLLHAHRRADFYVPGSVEGHHRFDTCMCVGKELSSSAPLLVTSTHPPDSA